MNDNQIGLCREGALERIETSTGTLKKLNGLRMDTQTNAVQPSMLFLDACLHPNVVLFLDVGDLGRLRIAFGGDFYLERFVPGAVYKYMAEHPRFHARLRTVLPLPQSHTTPFSWFRHLMCQEQLRIRVDVLEHTLLGYSFVYEEDEDVSARALRKADVPCVRSDMFPLPDSRGRSVFEFSFNKLKTTTSNSVVHHARSDCAGKQPSLLLPFKASYSAFAVRARVYSAASKAVKQHGVAFCICMYGGENAVIIDDTAGSEDDRQEGNHRSLCLENKTETEARLWFSDTLDSPVFFVIRRIASAVYVIDRVFVRV